MRVTALLLLAALPLAGAPTDAAEHLVWAEARDARLVRAAAEREANLSRLDGLLQSPAAARAASLLGTDRNRIRAALPALSDAEARDLAARAAALTADPTAGLRGDVNDLLIVFLIVAIVVLVLKAVD